MYRQGDVLIVKLRSIPNLHNAQPCEVVADRVILARGEATGHVHSISASVARAFSGTDAGDILIVDATTLLTHQEHESIPIPAGVYRIVHQREYAPEKARAVGD